jgi:hypothetical protein
MIPLCRLTKWETTTVTRGRGVGSKSTKRLVIGGDKYCWHISEETQKEKDNSFAGKKFYKGFSHLIPEAIKHFKLEQDFLIDVITDALQSKTDIVITQEDIKKLKGSDPSDAGKTIDSVFQTNYNEVYDQEVRDHIFGDKTEDKE